MNEVKLSILIPTLPTRALVLAEICSNLATQIQNVDENVEIITCLDAKRVSIGAKRSRMLTAVQGDYFTFVDDDDEVGPDYISELLKTFRDTPGVDLVTFDVLLTYLDGPPIKYDRQVKYTYSTLQNTCKTLSPSLIEASPNHIHARRTALVQDISFPDKQYVEDLIWSRQANSRVETHVNISRVLYYYNFNPVTSETRP